MTTGTPSRLGLNVFLDSDGPIADFRTALRSSGLSVDMFKHRAGTYLYLPITPCAKYTIDHLWKLDKENKIRLWVATKTPANCPYAYTEKVLWYRHNFPELENRLILAHDKSLLGSENDILFDDRPHKGNASLFKGTFVLFEEDNPFDSWKKLLNTVHQKVTI